MNDNACQEKRTPFFCKIRNRLISGILLLIPFAITLVILRWLFGSLRNLLRPIVEFVLRYLERVSFIDVVPDGVVQISIYMISGIILFLFLYIVGSIGQVVLGKKMINTLEHAFLQVPLVRNIYSASKQVVDAISLQRKAVFQSVVLIEFPRPGFKAIGFLTGHLDDTQGKKYCRVFIPTTPNPTTGFLEIIPSEEVVTTKLTVEEAFKMIISGGLVAPNLFFTVDEQGSKR